MSDTLSDFIPIALFVVLLALRWWLGTLIGNAAQRRGRSPVGWLIGSLIVGPLTVWLVYLIFVHWRAPKLLPQLRDDAPLESEETAPTEQPGKPINADLRHYRLLGGGVLLERCY